jgi:hypothetical protein
MEEGVHDVRGVLGVCVHAACRIGRLGVAVYGYMVTRANCIVARKRAREYGAVSYLHGCARRCRVGGVPWHSACGMPRGGGSLLAVHFFGGGS